MYGCVACLFVCMCVSTSLINSVNSIETEQSNSWQDIIKQGYGCFFPLLEQTFDTPASSAPVERVFSQSGLFMRPHRARLGNMNLSYLVFIKCNKHLK